ncbi:integrase core domain-containing protein [Marinobacterium weihaiense]|uniref:Integrase core domain-containing protein n=1 Tax=Marinobacterium weihaiense TaxID=2851016 RepID=A0ABS6M9P5_9GAMM|nr:integrase core domain-containing protein [Marinobacterium weihaiense]MBV0932999.1 integrase core domain-containing protein [Marinobacterium weihaiense]
MGVEHRLTNHKSPQTNGIMKRVNGRISDVLKTHHFDNREDLEQTLLRYAHQYNHRGHNQH